MLGRFFKRLQGRHYRKFYSACQPIVARINAIEEAYQQLSEEQLRAKTAEFKERIEAGREAVRRKLGEQAESEKLETALQDKDQETLEELLPEAFAVVKNAARRLCGRTLEVVGQETAWEMVHFDVQLIGGIALHRNNIAEMQTGEGKTLVATCPLYLNALTGRNCQLVTVNEFLAQRDSEWMGYIYEMLGLTVGCIKNAMDPATKREMYGRDITYGTASEFGFDYLRDNGMASRKEDQVQRDHYYCIIDEVDSILIDEARTPLIISGPMQEERPLPFNEVKPVVRQVVRAQEQLCNTLVAEAKKELEKEDGDIEDAILKLLQVRWGMPRNKQLLRLMEKGEYRKLLEKYDLEYNSDMYKTQKFELKEQLYFVIDEKQQQADLTEKGRQLAAPDRDDAFMLPDMPSMLQAIDARNDLDPEAKQKAKQEAEAEFTKRSEEIHTLSQLLRAYCLYERDTQYVVQEGKVQIVDENTGRIMPGRRWSDGLHQAIEAKENVTIEKETKTYATVTIQNFFRLYEKLAGMTGTAETEAGEFFEIYKLKVMVIPTHRPNIREDLNDVVYKTRREKFNAVIEDIREVHGRGQPVLVGTASVEASEVLSRMMKRANLPHTVLNAKFHQQEAEIVARAGQPGAITIATNMAGRGTDIKLGEGVADRGGLYVCGTERHESRRIDRQLRGRCARQGDPGMTRFYVSLEDDLMRLFANAGKISQVLQSSFQEGESLEHPMLNWSIQNAQKKVEQQNFSIRKRLLQYDDVLNNQREVIYGIRNDAIQSERCKDIIFEMIDEELEERLAESDSEDVSSLATWANSSFPIGLKDEDLAAVPATGRQAFLRQRIEEAYDAKAELEDPDALAVLERITVIRPIDRHWQNHLTEMEELRRSVGLRGYGQKDPLNEYKSEAFVYFQEMMENVRRSIATGFFRTASNVQAFQNMLSRLSSVAKQQGPEDQNLTLVGSAAQAAQQARGRQPAQTATADQPRQAGEQPGGQPELPRPAPKPVVRELPKIGRNEMVVIRRGADTQTLKFKKAEPLIRDEGWVLERKA
ncbi:MAG: preprotein translocase subunit SecA [Opitutales bacterium]